MEKKIPFSPPHVTDEMIAEVVDTLRSGWITTGPKTKRFEVELATYCGNQRTIGIASATIGLELMLHWYGIGAGDEVIVPAYTYCATANVIMHLGAKPVMVDVDADDLCISPAALRTAITPHTKAILPVDLGGLPVRYRQLWQVIEDARPVFIPKNEKQQKLGRILFLTDAAHSFGAEYGDRKAGTLADVSVFSFHAVKNLTTAEGGAIAFNLPAPFDNEELYREMNTRILHGQNKDALAKTKAGGWKYDIVEAGYKANMTDIQASLGLIQLKDYAQHLAHRKEIFKVYDGVLGASQKVILPVHEDADRTSSRHLYLARLKGATEVQRDAVIQALAERGIVVNVHYQPLPLLSFYRQAGYRAEDYPVALAAYRHEVTLPVYYDLTLDDARYVAEALLEEFERATA